MASIAPPGPSIRHRFAGRKPPFVQQRRILAAGRRLENIVEMAAHDRRGRRIHVKIDLAPVHDDQRADVVDPVRMVGVRMGQQDAVEPVDVRRRAIARARSGEVSTRTSVLAPSGPSLEQDRAAPAAVFRIVGIAGAPALADARHAARTIRSPRW